MTKQTSTKLIVTGAILIACLPMFVIIASLTAYYWPRQYYSRVILEVVSPEREAAAQALQRTPPELRGAAEIRQIRNTNLLEVGVYDHRPDEAAKKANSLALSLQQGSKRMEIKERAEPALFPARPNIFAIMIFGFGGGGLLAIIGLVLLIRGIARTTDAGESPTIA